LQRVWPNVDLGLQFRVSGAPDFEFKDGEISADASLRMAIRNFGADREILASTVQLGASLAVNIKDEKLQMDLSRVSVSGIVFDEDDCSTITGRSCIFPFTYKGQVYTECTGRDSLLGQKFWCPTKVDANGVFIQGSRNWGTCSASCQIVQRAVLPMINGEVEDILQEYVHPVLDLQRPLTGSLKDILELTDTSLSIADGAFRVWTSFSLGLASWVSQHFGVNASRRMAATSSRSLPWEDL